MKIEENYGGYKNVNYIQDGKSNYLVYIPDGVNADTGIHIHARGSGATGAFGGNAGQVAKILSQQNSGSVVIMPLAGYLNDDWDNKAMNMLDYVCDEYGITQPNLSYSGWSGGAFPAIKTTIEYINRNPDAPPQICFTLDDVSNNLHTSSQTPGRNRTAVLENGGKEAFTKNGTVIFNFQANGITKTYYQKQEASFAFADAGANVIRVTITSCGGHEGINDRFFAKNLEEYSSGNAVLPNENYRYELAVYDETTGKWGWKEIDYEDIKTKEALYNFIGSSSKPGITIKVPELSDIRDGFEINFTNENIGSKYAYLSTLQAGSINYKVSVSTPATNKLTSDLEYVEKFSNGLVQQIKKEQIASMTILRSSAACGRLLGMINSCIGGYNNASGQLLASLAEEAAAIMSFGQYMADMDMDLRNEVLENIGDKQDDPLSSDILDNGASVTPPGATVRPGYNGGSTANTPDSNVTDKGASVTPPGATIKPGYNSSGENTGQEYQIKEQIYEQDGYKVIVGMNENQVKTMKYQYEYATLDEAKKYYQYLLNEKQNTEFIDSIILNGKNVEVIFKSEILKNMNIQDLIKKYFIGRIEF